ncbi:MAG: 30S ribosomal protein S9 [Patescibacteria group bacterium]
MAIKMTKKTTQKQKVVKKIIPASAKRSSIVPTKGVELSSPKGQYIGAVGRRKTAVARVRLFEGQTDFIINGRVAGDYFAGIDGASAIYNRPFDLTGTKGKFAVSVRVVGSGLPSQLEAISHGISRGLVKYNPEFRIFLKQAGLLTRDDRMKETRKIGMGGKARRKRQSPKR